VVGIARAIEKGDDGDALFAGDGDADLFHCQQLSCMEIHAEVTDVHVMIYKRETECCMCSVMTRTLLHLSIYIIPLAFLLYIHHTTSPSPNSREMSRALNSRLLADLHTYWYKTCPAQSPIPKSVMMGWFMPNPEVDEHCRSVSSPISDIMDVACATV
jgi:hypothetical protein